MVSVTVKCRLCDQAMRLPRVLLPENDPLAIALTSLSGMTAHDECVAKASRERESKRKLEQQQRRKEVWKTICPPLYQHTDPAKLPLATKSPARFRQVMDWTPSSKGIGLFGVTGGGKTRTMYLLVEAQWISGREVETMTHTEFSTTAVRLAFNGHKGEQDRWVARLKSTDILFIDDLGKSRFTTADGSAKHAEETLWDICEHRWQQEKPFFFTCNKKNGDDLAASMSEDKGQPFVRRLREFCEIISA